MKKVLAIVTLLYCFTVIYTRSVNAFEFTKSVSNPLPIAYIQDYVYNFQAHIYKDGSLYKGIIPAQKINQQYYSLVALESLDGISWRMTKEILVNQGRDISNPRLVIDKEGNKKVFFAETDDQKIIRIYSIDCDNDLNCSQVPNLVLEPDINNNTEMHGYFAPYVLNLDKYYLFYGVWGQNGIKVRLSYSDTLSNWQKCPNDLIGNGADGPFPYIENNSLYLFYHQSDSSGIKLSKTTLPLNCNSIFEDLGYLLWPSAWYDQSHMIYPSIVKDDQGLRLYYTGLSNTFNWSLNVAFASIIIPTSTPVPTVLPTSTPTATPTPIPEKNPIIIIPGLFASWNKEAILHNIIQPQSSWQLNPIVNDYKGIISTLKNLDYEENKNLFIFAYDWRKPILNIIEDLNNFINNLPINNLRFTIVGHSLGGLIGRIYSQKYNNTQLDKIITVGSPHYGVSQTYKIVEAGEIDRFNDYLWLAEKIIMLLNKNNLETDKQTISRIFPVLKDLFPIYNFLKKNGNEISISNMKIKNELLTNESYKLNESNLTYLKTIAGETGNTLKGFNVDSPTIIDKLFNNYPDGRPLSSFSEIGDYTVLSKSATIGTPTILNLSHNELIYKKEAIKKILNLLDIQYNDSQIVEGKGTVIDSSLIFLIKSPATMEVVSNGQTYQEHDGVIFIENAQNGDYQLKVKGIEKGDYEVIVGQIGKTNDVWDSIYGETNSNKIDSYKIYYRSDSPNSITVNDLATYLKINGYQYKNMKNLEKMYQDLIRKKDFIGLEKLENYEFNLEKNFKNKIKSENINKEIKSVEKKINRFKKSVNQVVLEQIVKRMDIIEKEFASKNYRYCQILLNTIERLLKIVKM